MGNKQLKNFWQTIGAYLNMPKYDGFYFVETLKKHKALPGIAIIILRRHQAILTYA
jgi:hypothetical protein